MSKRESEREIPYGTFIFDWNKTSREWRSTCLTASDYACEVVYKSMQINVFFSIAYIVVGF